MMGAGRRMARSAITIIGLVWANAATAAPSAPPSGIWASSGYGWILQIGADGAQRLYHTSGGVCVPDNGDGPLGEMKSLVVARMDPDNRSFTSFTRQNITRQHWTRLDALPGACGNTTPRPDAIENFEFVWHNFADHYAFFPDRGIDWYRTYQRFRPQISATTTPDQLYAVLVAMFETLEDRHITLNRAGAEEYRSGLGPIVNAVKRDYDALPVKQRTGFYGYFVDHLQPHKQLIGDHYLGKTAQSAANGLVVWGKIGDLGYLRVDAESGYAEEDGYLAEAPVLSAALDKALAQFAGARAVILDLRFNLGGNDGHGLAIAGRFTTRPYTAYTKYARDHDSWTTPQPVTVLPTGLRQFTGPLYILTSNVTVSAGENLALAMMGRPAVRRYGETTASVMSDQLTKTMPNGWTFSVSNEVFQAIDGRVYETRGIAPDVTVTNSVLLTAATLDPVIERVLNDARSNPNPNDNGKAQ
jgi:carboxyl-terminal processing protease